MKLLMHIVLALVVSGSCLAEVHHVPADFPTIQYAVDAAVDGDEIIVAPGTYTSTADEVVDMRGKEIWLHSSGGADVTIIDGEGLRRGIYCHNDETPETIIEGFTITNGNAFEGGGIHIGSNTGSSPTISNCKFINNNGDKGGGFFISAGNNVSVPITNCLFADNASLSTGGGLYISNSDLNLTDCIFIANDSRKGGGIYCTGGESSLNNCEFLNNTASNNGSSADGGGFYIYQGGVSLNNCKFINNIADSSGGGLYSTEWITELYSCNFEGNVAELGGGFFCRRALITGCNFIQNTSQAGGGIYSDGNNAEYSPTISNSNFCENDPDAIYGNWVNKGGNDFLNTCGDVQGACCVKDTCYEVELIFCEALDGEWLGYNATCEEDSCVEPPQYGACCVNGEAIPLFDYDCDRILGTFMGEGTNPDDVTCPVHCAEDITGDGVVDVSDLLAIIGVWGVCP